MTMKPWEHPRLAAARRAQDPTELRRKAAKSRRREDDWITIEEMDLHLASGGGLKPRADLHVVPRWRG